MNLSEICKLQVNDITNNDCALFLWVTWPFIFDAKKVIESWGFKYSGLAWEWIKYNPITKKYSFGTGYGTRKNLEPCLLARKGKPILKNKSIRDFLFSKRREHSRKPNEQYERIESMYDGPYLEMFARQQRDGWDSWGNEVNKWNDN